MTRQADADVLAELFAAYLQASQYMVVRAGVNDSRWERAWSGVCKAVSVGDLDEMHKSVFVEAVERGHYPEGTIFAIPSGYAPHETQLLYVIKEGKRYTVSPQRPTLKAGIKDLDLPRLISMLHERTRRDQIRL